jgi:hypothetical protein
VLEDERVVRCPPSNLVQRLVTDVEQRHSRHVSFIIAAGWPITSGMIEDDDD